MFILFALLLGFIVSTVVGRTSSHMLEKIKSYDENDNGWKPIVISLSSIVMAILLWLWLDRDWETK